MALLMERRVATSAPVFKSVPQGAATQVWAAVVADADEIAAASAKTATWRS
jgi:hypothetical protein